jgi:hypothetical protein
MNDFSKQIFAIRYCVHHCDFACPIFFTTQRILINQLNQFEANERNY